MTAENLKVLDSNDVVVIIGVLLHQVEQYFDFDSCLMLKPFLVSDDLHGHE